MTLSQKRANTIRIKGCHGADIPNFWGKRVGLGLSMAQCSLPAGCGCSTSSPSRGRRRGPPMVGNGPVLCDVIVGWACLVEPSPPHLPLLH